MTMRDHETLQTPAGRRFELPDADVTFFARLFVGADADRLLADLRRTTEWRQEVMEREGREIPLPRLTAWYGDPDRSYSYSGITMESLPWTEPLLEIKARVEAVSETAFNSVLLNLYRDGRDGVGWHSDNEPELGEEPVIGSVSLGGTRKFALRHKKRRDLKFELDLTHGSLLVMRGATQRFWLHRVPKTEDEVEPRINLTFRRIADGGPDGS